MLDNELLEKEIYIQQSGKPTIFIRLQAKVYSIDSEGVKFPLAGDRKLRIFFLNRRAIACKE